MSCLAGAATCLLQLSGALQSRTVCTLLVLAVVLDAPLAGTLMPRLRLMGWAGSTCGVPVSGVVGCWVSMLCCILQDVVCSSMLVRSGYILLFVLWLMEYIDVLFVPPLWLRVGIPIHQSMQTCTMVVHLLLR